MGAKKIMESLTKKIISNDFDFIVANFANPHLVSQSGDREATIKAIEAVDKCLGKIIKNVLAKEGVVVITADHGQAEDLPAALIGQPSLNPVPFILVANQWEGRNIGRLDTLDHDLSLIEPAGELLDVAPTILKIMGLAQPPEMIGRSLI